MKSHLELAIVVLAGSFRLGVTQCEVSVGKGGGDRCNSEGSEVGSVLIHTEVTFLVPHHTSHEEDAGGELNRS